LQAEFESEQAQRNAELVERDAELARSLAAEPEELPSSSHQVRTF
jgi:hypothetical protein